MVKYLPARFKTQLDLWKKRGVVQEHTPLIFEMCNHTRTKEQLQRFAKLEFDTGVFSSLKDLHVGINCKFDDHAFTWPDYTDEEEAEIFRNYCCHRKIRVVRWTYDNLEHVDDHDGVNESDSFSDFKLRYSHDLFEQKISESDVFVKSPLSGLLLDENQNRTRIIHVLEIPPLQGQQKSQYRLLKGEDLEYYRSVDLLSEARDGIEAEIEAELKKRLLEEEEERLRLEDEKRSWVLNGSAELKRAVIFEIDRKVKFIPEDSLNIKLRSIPIDLLTRVSEMDREFLLKNWRFTPPPKSNFDGNPESRHIAIFGSTGSGKSAFVRVLHNLSDEFKDKNLEDTPVEILRRRLRAATHRARRGGLDAVFFRDNFLGGDGKKVLKKKELIASRKAELEAHIDSEEFQTAALEERRYYQSSKSMIEFVEKVADSDIHCLGGPECGVPLPDTCYYRFEFLRKNDTTIAKRGPFPFQEKKVTPMRHVLNKSRAQKVEKVKMHIMGAVGQSWVKAFDAKAETVVLGPYTVNNNL